MYGTIGWNFIISAVSAVLAFFVSLSSNLFLTALIQSLYVFGIMFLVTFIFRFLVGLLVAINLPVDTNLEFTSTNQPLDAGNNVNMQTPNNDDFLQDILRQNYMNNGEEQQQDFSPLNPTRLSSAPETQADPLVEAVRSSLRQN
jgi:hypothetical protein